MLKLNILKPVTIVGREYDAGDSVEVHKTLLHYEKKKIANGIKALLDAGRIEAVSGKDDTYKVKGDIVVNVLGLEFKKDAEFVAPKVFDYVDEVGYPKWIARGLEDGLWTYEDANQLSAVAEGSVTISILASKGELTDTVSVTGTVTPKVIIPTSVSMSPASPTTTVGGTVKLSVSITPANSTDKTGVWTSATPAVATVAKDGTVTGVAEGTSGITFTTNSGAKTAKRTVTVGPAA
jgi:hypothetical protein